MTQVWTRTKKWRVQFRKMANGTVFYASDGTTPRVKTGNRTELPTASDPWTTPAQTTLDDTTLACLPVPRLFLGNPRAIG